jgi:RNA polymerase sigma factor (TIGR02999 family)
MASYGLTHLRGESGHGTFRSFAVFLSGDRILEYDPCIGERRPAPYFLGRLSKMNETMAGLSPPGDREDLDRLFSELYRDLRRLAHARLRRREAPTLLDTTSLVHESYLRFLSAGHVQVADRSRFLAYAASAMRSVVVDFVRQSGAQRRGGDGRRIPLDGTAELSAAGEDEVLRVHEALEQLAGVSQRLVSVVEMRYFAGMNEGEIAEALGLTERTVRRDWEKARIILAAALKG